MGNMQCLSLTLIVLGAVLAVGAALHGLWEMIHKQRRLEERIESAKVALERDRESGDPDLPQLAAALGRENLQWREVLWLPELFALQLSREQFRSLRVESFLVALGVVLSTVGSLVGS